MVTIKKVVCKSDKFGIKIQRYANSCLFYLEWDNDDLDKINFIDEVFAVKNTHEPDICTCGRNLSLGYVWILRMLEEAGLLPKSFVPMCCYCHVLACVGFYVPDEWDDVYINEAMHYFHNGATLIISATHISTQERFDLRLKIHDIDLVLKTGRISNDT